ncbi:DUF7482 domain-containing protein [Haloechinothrix halophila]|uniref:DUF7482 domain-containing protein n=1 Tax=Haloechinothrix halophila TaxID=1069073 RepID=UPI0004128035|nr:hypothetical protein [Haloechinothrix halophila]
MTSPRETTDETATEPARRHWPWWVPWTAALAVAAIVIGVGSWIVTTQDDADDAGAMAGMSDGMSTDTGALPPPVTGYYDGERIQFLHTEASDAEVATTLTDMMGGSPVVHVPSLAEVSDRLVAPVYVFTNGIQPDDDRGPFGFQPDVFSTVPGDPGYTPLRAVHLVEWQPDAEPALLTAADDIQQAQRAGDIAVTEPGIVVNMPITIWPGGRR